jgi:hypothetical protein
MKQIKRPFIDPVILDTSKYRGKGRPRKTDYMKTKEQILKDFREDKRNHNVYMKLTDDELDEYLTRHENYFSKAFDEYSQTILEETLREITAKEAHNTHVCKGEK